MQNPLPKDNEGRSVGEVFREIGTSTKDLIQSEMDLARAEINESAGRLGKYSAQAAVFGALLTISVFPFLAFLVIGLGDLLGGMYWLSALIVAAVCAAIGGALAYRAYNKMKERNLMLPRTRRTLEHEKDTMSEKVQEVRDTTQTNIRNIRDNAKRRMS